MRAFIITTGIIIQLTAICLLGLIIYSIIFHPEVFGQIAARIINGFTSTIN